MKQKYLLEIATFSLMGAVEAFRAGAQRIELCENPHEGGTTPSYGMMATAKKLINIPIFPIIRPRGGHFVYSKSEREVIKQDIQICKELGYPGIVVGLLNEKGQVDVKNLKSIVKWAFPMQITFHRAFDRSKNPLRALDEIIDCGCHRILTSGQYPSVFDGKENVRILVERANGKIAIMPGSGLNSQNLKEIAHHTGATEFHTAARKTIFDKNPFSPKTMNEKMSYTSIDKKEIQKLLKVLSEL
ncbi:MAG: copper homeostasis protein CutC [Bacteroidetes bacterium]|nr:copper homeostasis protein CutC [Bacteroidota bacterium]